MVGKIQEDREIDIDLFLAARRGDSESVGILLAKGANPNFFMSGYALTVLAVAIQENHFDCAKILLEQGANANQGWGRDFTNQYPVFTAISWGRVNFVKLLIDHGLDINVRNRDGRTPLIFTATNNGQQYVEIADLLLQAGSDVNAQDCDGTTPLMATVDHEVSAIGIMRMILDYHPDLHLSDKDGLTVRQLAEKMKALDCIELLNFHHENLILNDRIIDNKKNQATLIF